MPPQVYTHNTKLGGGLVKLIFYIEVMWKVGGRVKSQVILQYGDITAPTQLSVPTLSND